MMEEIQASCSASYVPTIKEPVNLAKRAHRRSLEKLMYGELPTIDQFVSRVAVLDMLCATAATEKLFLIVFVSTTEPQRSRR
ncbi:hypothetical protein AVEN_136031-1 [Araneus ventricosus]|uniref:Uncharacterized protein n=1 Tax=Araneus ventricosus TaxID=182803 RepID=A0A4Y2ET89_ARAVE|nr:hypothetical protein AVEN_136031-1 [Araneus ventricosus]